MMRGKAFIAALALLSAIANGQVLEGVAGVETLAGECLYCQVVVIDEHLMGLPSVESYRCVTDEDQEGDGEAEMSYELNLPSYFIEAHKATLDSGVSTICIPGGTATRTPDLIEPDVVSIPFGADIRFVEGRPQNQRHLLASGKQSVLVVRVTSQSSTQSLSSATLANSIFGVGGLQFNMASQFSACSSGKADYGPATGSIVTNGVMDLFLDQKITNMGSALENQLIAAAKVLLGVDKLETSFANILFCMPSGILNSGGNAWVAYSYSPGQFSFYNDGFCNTLSNTMHELGHNLGLKHSSDRRDDGTIDEFGDLTCQMGGTARAVGGPAQCFNGHKSSILGWYKDREIVVNPTLNGPWSGNLAGIVDYHWTTANQHVVVNVGTLYLQYNLAESFNVGTREYRNLVTIVKGATSTSVSFMEKAIGPKETAVIGDITIEVCEQVEATFETPKHMVVSVRLNSQSSNCPGQTPVTAPTTEAPVVAPSINDGICEDAPPTIKVLEFDGLDRTCAWLSIRTAAQKEIYCVPGTTVYDQCEESCGRCEDFCEDNPDASVVMSSTIGAKPCSWLAIRPPWMAIVCVPGHDAYDVCRETCENCSSLPPTLAPTPAPVVVPTKPPTLAPTPQPTLAPTPAPVVVPTKSPTLAPTPAPVVVPTKPPTLAPTPAPVVVPTKPPTLAPTSAPVVVPTKPPTLAPTPAPVVVPTKPPTLAPTPAEVCEDTAHEVKVLTFDGDGQEKGCAWLSIRTPAQKEIYCIPGTLVWDLCEETCGRCEDFCDDNPDGSFFVDSRLGNKDCRWLAIRPPYIDALCVPGHGAYEVCKETCESCV